MRAISFSMIQVVTMAALSLMGSSLASGGVFTDRSTWVANATTITDYDFGTMTPGASTSYNTSAGLTAVGFNIVGFGATNTTTYSFKRAQGDATHTPWLDWNSGAVGLSDFASVGFALPIIRITFTGGPVTAFAVDLGMGNATTGAITVTPHGLSTTTITAQARPTLTFYGVTSTTAFDYVDITPQDFGSAYAIIDNISRGTAAGDPPPPETPEVTTMVSVATGLLVLAYRHKAKVGMQAV